MTKQIQPLEVLFIRLVRLQFIMIMTGCDLATAIKILDTQEKENSDAH